jgi:hypothetical protein
VSGCQALVDLALDRLGGNVTAGGVLIDDGRVTTA